MHKATRGPEAWAPGLGPDQRSTSRPTTNRRRLVLILQQYITLTLYQQQAITQVGAGVFLGDILRAFRHKVCLGPTHTPGSRHKLCLDSWAHTHPWASRHKLCLGPTHPPGSRHKLCLGPPPQCPTHPPPTPHPPGPRLVEALLARQPARLPDLPVEALPVPCLPLPAMSSLPLPPSPSLYTVHFSPSHPGNIGGGGGAPTTVCLGPTHTQGVQDATRLLALAHEANNLVSILMEL